MEIAVKSGEVSVPTKQLLRHHQREDMRGELDNMESMQTHLKSAQDKANVTKRMRRLQECLHTQSPQPLDGSAKDKLTKRAKELEERITQGMLSQEEMRKNPAGAVGRHMKWEKANKAAILEWKNIQLMREPNSDDPDLANFERLRPVGAQDRFRGDAQINGVMSYRNVPQENWDEAFHGKGPDSALKQAERVNTEQHAKQTRKPLSDEQRRAIGERLAKARLAKKQNPLSEVDRPALIQEGEQAPSLEG